MGLFGGDSGENVQHGAVDTIIGEKAKLKGEIQSSGSISVNGEFEGKLETKGDLIIGRGSKVVGSVAGGSVVVSGKVDGNIVASSNLEITKSGKVHGDLVGGRIVIEEGASYRGKVSVQQGAEAVEEETEIVEEDEVEEIEGQQAKSQLF